MEKPELILIGGGGHCKSCIDVIEAENKFTIFGIIDRKSMIMDEVLLYPVIGYDEELPGYVEGHFSFLITLGHIRSNEKRVHLYTTLKKMNALMPVIISPLAHVSKHSLIGNGTIIMHHALVNAGSEIGENCIINSKALIEHDCTIGDHCHIAPGAILNGNVKVGSGSFIGSGSVVVQGVEIAPNSFVKANSLIKENI